MLTLLLFNFSSAWQTLQYTCMVIPNISNVLETLRKYPALPILHRECTSDCFIEEANLKVKKGQRFIISVLGLHYDEEYWPDPEKFDPQRFSEENKRNIVPYSYVPFGEGPRNCIGE